MSTAAARATFVTRLIALIIDAVVMGVLGAVLGLVAAVAPASIALYVTTVLSIVPFLGLAAMELFLAQSPGKMAMGIKIRSLEGNPAPFEALLMRQAIKAGPAAVFLVGAVLGIVLILAGMLGIGLLVIGLFGAVASLAGLAFFVGCFFALGETRLTLHDSLSKTSVCPSTDALPGGFQVPTIPGVNAAAGEKKDDGAPPAAPPPGQG
jgi:uncharacterized RDD family membrane protein YckC